jgi:Family of unknown function (DUF6370)
MRLLTSLLLLLAFAVVTFTGAYAGGKDEKVTLKGTITCAKCGLNVETKCMTVIVAKDKDKKDVTYYFDPASSKKFHSKICTEAMEGSVEGTVKTEGDKKIVTPSKVTFK